MGDGSQRVIVVVVVSFMSCLGSMGVVAIARMGMVISICRILIFF